MFQDAKCIFQIPNPLLTLFPPRGLAEANTLLTSSLSQQHSPPTKQQHITKNKWKLLNNDNDNDSINKKTINNLKINLNNLELV